MRWYFLAGLTAVTASFVESGGPETYVPGHAFDRFITIWLENEDFGSARLNPNLQALHKNGILLSQYYGLTHPSQPNYIASVAGDHFGLNHDDYVDIPHNVSTVVDLLDTKNIDWRGYFEGLPGPGFMGAGSTDDGGAEWDYVRKHNPFIPFKSISMNGTRLAKIQRMVEFQNDVKANTLPQYAHISPNMKNDGHNTSLDFSAQWTLDFLMPLLVTPSFVNRTLILLTYDESATYERPNRVVSLLLGGAVPSELKNTVDDTVYTHYSILSTLQNNWDLPHLGRYDVGANVFDFVAKKTNYVNHPPSNLGTVNNSLSYKGCLNNGKNMWAPIPSPNLLLTGAGGQGIERQVKNMWQNPGKEPSPYDGSGDLVDGGDGISNPNGPVYKPQKANLQTGVP